jgi:O-antigen ligase
MPKCSNHLGSRGDNSDRCSSFAQIVGIARKSFLKALQTIPVIVLLIVFLLGDEILSSFPSSTGYLSREVVLVLNDLGTQRMIFTFLGIYFLVFFFLQSRTKSVFWKVSNPSLWVGCLLLVNMISYAFGYLISTPALMLQFGIILGRGIGVCAIWSKSGQKSLSLLIVYLLVALPALASVWKTNVKHIFEYRDHLRWAGPWDNPNVYGLLLGTGMALAAGGAVSSLEFRVLSSSGNRNWKSGIRECGIPFLCLLAAGLMGRGLFHSYSRGAWVAMACGLAYVAVRWYRAFRLRQAKARQVYVSWPSINWLPLSVVLMSLAILLFWHFRKTEWHPARRAFSVGNQNDFSWRNRIAAWQGTLQIMAKYPWLGAGWNQPEPLFEHYYLPPKLNESASIEMNDYLMLGATLGLPALFCFGAYLWLCLTQKSEIEVDWIKTACRAGAIVLAVGFWFDGGLFKLPTASTFWILLELGRANEQKVTKAMETPLKTVQAGV